MKKKILILLNTLLLIICFYSYQSDQNTWYEKYKNISFMGFLGRQVPSSPLSPVRGIRVLSVSNKTESFTKARLVICLTYGYGQMSKSTVIIISMRTYLWMMLFVFSFIQSLIYFRRQKKVVVGAKSAFVS